MGQTVMTFLSAQNRFNQRLTQNGWVVQHGCRFELIVDQILQVEGRRRRAVKLVVSVRDLVFPPLLPQPRPLPFGDLASTTSTCVQSTWNSAVVTCFAIKSNSTTVYLETSKHKLACLVCSSSDEKLKKWESSLSYIHWLKLKPRLTWRSGVIW